MPGAEHCLFEAWVCLKQVGEFLQEVDLAVVFQSVGLQELKNYKN
jgi:hypothetical protein